MNYTDLALSLLFHGLFLFIALCGLYLGYISKVQEQVLHDQVKQNLEKVVDNLPEDTETTNTMFTLAPIFKNLSTKYYNIGTSATVINNTRVHNMMILTAVSLALFILIPYLFLKFSCKKKVGIMHIILENFIFFACIGAFELYFFKTVIFKYVPVMPSVFKQAFYDSVRKYFSK